MAVVFERIRAAVLHEGTRPSPYDATQHAANQAEFKENLQGLCQNAHLRADVTADHLWWQIWTKIRYAGFRAAYVTNQDIPSLAPFLKDFRLLTGSEWRFDPEGIRHGKAVREFFDKTGPFAGISYNKNERKLRTMLTVAAAFQGFPPGVQPIVALFGEGYDQRGDDALWRAHKRLAKLVGFTTALHVMMDIGFNCVKPDIWLVRLMCRLGWIESVLPSNTLDTAIGRTYGTPPVAREVITCARRVAAAIHAWNSDAPLREFDLVMVKYGQRAGEWGIVRSLHTDWRPVQQIMEWHPPQEAEGYDRTRTGEERHGARGSN